MQGQDDVVEAIRESGDTVTISFTPNVDPYIRDVRVSSAKDSLEIETIKVSKGTFEHRLVDFKGKKLAHNIWWDLENDALMYSGDVIEYAGDDLASSLNHRELVDKIHNSNGSIL